MKIAFTNKRLLETLLIGGVNQKQILNANVAADGHAKFYVIG